MAAARKPLDFLPGYTRSKTAGDLRHRITIQTATETLDTANQPIPGWNDVDKVWGEYERMSGFETEAAGDQIRSIALGVVTIRKYDGITPKMRLKVNGHGLVNVVLNIVSVGHPDPTSGLMGINVREPEPEIVQGVDGGS